MDSQNYRVFNAAESAAGWTDIVVKLPDGGGQMVVLPSVPALVCFDRGLACVLEVNGKAALRGTSPLVWPGCADQTPSHAWAVGPYLCAVGKDCEVGVYDSLLPGFVQMTAVPGCCAVAARAQDCAVVVVDDGRVRCGVIRQYLTPVNVLYFFGLHPCHRY